MNEVRHSDLTFGQIAEAAKTSRTVLYRRWATMFELLEDLYTYKARKLFEEELFDNLPDTGSLRGDLVQLLTRYQHIYDGSGAEILKNYFYLKARRKTTDQQSAESQAIDGKEEEIVKQLLEKAAVRGEKIKEINELTRMLPFHLVHIQNLLRGEALSGRALEVMIDEVLMPVFIQR